MSEKAQSSQATKGLPDVSRSLIWMINFGFLGVQTAFTLQSSQMSRIFQTLGADPNSLGWFFILPPLAGLLVQPVVGYCSDRTWAPKLGGRRLPYLLLGTLIAVIVMILLPNSGSFGFGYGSLAALLFGAITVAFLDVSSNMAMQPFKMMVGDMVNDDQKSYAYGIQSFLSNTGAVIAAVLPFLFAYMGLKNTAAKGVVPQTVVVAFYVGAALLIITSLFTIFKVKEYDMVEADTCAFASDLVDACSVIFASPMVLAAPHPFALVGALLVNTLRPKIKSYGVIGSYGWGGVLAGTYDKLITTIKPNKLGEVIVKGLPTDVDYQKLDDMAKQIIESCNN